MLMTAEMNELSELLDDCLWVAQTHAQPSTYFSLFIVFAALTGVLLILSLVFICLYCRAREMPPAEMKPLVPTERQMPVSAPMVSALRGDVRRRQTGNYVAARWE